MADTIMAQGKATNLISVIVRAHDPAKDWVLMSALRSVSQQSHDNVELVLILQNFSDVKIAALTQDLSELFSGAGSSFQIRLIVGDATADLRSKALNVGLELSRGNRILFLDYDDVLYVDALERLTRRMSDSGAACVVGSVDLAYVEYDYAGKNLSISRKERFFLDHPSVERLRHNSFIPIHSFMIDKAKIRNLKFSESMRLFEDYAFLLELSTREAFDFFLFKEKSLGEYRVERVGGASIADLSKANPRLYGEQRRMIWDLRKRLGFCDLIFYLSHPFYYPIKTKLSRFFNKI